MSWATPSHTPHTLRMLGMPGMLALGLLAALAAALLAALLAPPAARAQTAITVDNVVQRLVIDDSDATVPPDPEGERGPLAVDHVLRFTVNQVIQKSAITAVSVTIPTGTAKPLRGIGPQQLDATTGGGTIGPSTCELAPRENVVWDCVVGRHTFDLFAAPKGEYTLSVIGGRIDYSVTISPVAAPFTGQDLAAATTTLTIADVVEVETVTFELAENEPSTRAAGSTDGIDLVLKILNANNAAADPDAIATILVTGAQFTLSSTAPGSSCTSSSCQWTARSVAQLGGRGAESIAINVKSSTAVSGTVTVQVLTASGQAHNAESPQLTFSGPAAKLVLGAPSGTLLNEASDGNRDEIRIQVSAQDSADNPAELPSSFAITVRNPDGRTVAATDIAREQLAPDSNGNVYIRLRTEADSDDPLAVGEYTLRVSRTNLVGERAFRVAGKASAVAVTVADPTWSGGVARIVVNADVTDAEGQPVADGTSVNFSALPIGTVGAGGAQLIATGGSTIRTVNGRASAEFLAASSGGAYVTVTADGEVGVQTINVPASPGGGGSADPVGVGGLSEVGVNTYASWQSSTATRASELFAELPARGIDAMFKRDSATNRFVPYAERSGRPLPGAVDFTIELGDILWLSG